MGAPYIIQDEHDARFREFLVLLDGHPTEFDIEQFTFGHSQLILAKILIFAKFPYLCLM